MFSVSLLFHASAQYYGGKKIKMIRVLDGYARDRNINDSLLDEIEGSYLYFKLNVLADINIRLMFVDIIIEFGKGYVIKILRYIASKMATHCRKDIEIPEFKEEYGMHFLNRKGKAEQFVIIIEVLLNLLEPNTVNMRKLKTLVDYFYKKMQVQESRDVYSKKQKAIINYV